MQAMEAYLQTTLSLEQVDGVTIPFQNGIPVPAFELQERPVLTLNGKWRKRRFRANHHFSMAPRSAEWLDELSKNETEFLKGAPDSEWESHAVPLPENRLTGKEERNSAETYEDGVWYQRDFVIDRLESEKSYTLKSLGINYVADIWINGEWIGFHEGGFTPFAFDVSSCLRQGVNEIRIRIDNPPWGSREDIIPAVRGTDFFNYTGIIQDLYLESTDRVHISRADIVPRGTGGVLEIRVVVLNQGDTDFNGMLRGTIYEVERESEHFMVSPIASRLKGSVASTYKRLARDIELKAGETRVVSLEATIMNPKLWSPGTPNLYVAEFEIFPAGENSERAGDSFSTQFGIRTVNTERTQIKLNDQPIFLAGIARHEEWPAFGRTAAWDRIRADLEQIQGQHANMVRTGHYPNHVYTYLLLDRLGLAAMCEIPLWQFETAHYKIQEVRRLSDQMWREMVFSLYNRPSVLLWSTQNESIDVPLRLAHNRRLVEDLRTHYDDGRLITQSAAADQPGANDPSMKPLDVAGWTMYFGVFHGGNPYEGTLQFLKEAHQAFPDKPILNTEFGHWTGDSDAEAPQQTAIYESTLRALLEKATVFTNGKGTPDGYVAGMNFWIMYDWYVNHNQWIDTFGLFHMDRVQKKPVANQLAEDYMNIVGNQPQGLLPSLTRR